jgi:hypothetical protein
MLLKLKTVKLLFKEYYSGDIEKTVAFLGHECQGDQPALFLKLNIINDLLQQGIENRRTKNALLRTPQKARRHLMRR